MTMRGTVSHDENLVQQGKVSKKPPIKRKLFLGFPPDEVSFYAIRVRTII